MIGEVSSDDLCEPFARFSNWLVHSLSQRLLDLLELCHHTVPARLPSQLKDAPPGFGADEHKAEVSGSSPITDPRLLQKRTRSQGPSLRWRYPAFSLSGRRRRP